MNNTSYFDEHFPYKRGAERANITLEKLPFPPPPNAHPNNVTIGFLLFREKRKETMYTSTNYLIRLCTGIVKCPEDIIYYAKTHKTVDCMERMKGVGSTISGNVLQILEKYCGISAERGKKTRNLTR